MFTLKVHCKRYIPRLVTKTGCLKGFIYMQKTRAVFPRILRMFGGKRCFLVLEYNLPSIIQAIYRNERKF